MSRTESQCALRLQRGRRPRTPERKTHPRTRVHQHRFNGAGVRGRRRESNPSSSTGDDGASTGPASEDAGETTGVNAVNTQAKLQRGRRPRTPERRTPLTSTVLPYAASTGPASEDAGEVLADAAIALAKKASTGPASEDAGEVRPTTAPSTSPPGFNGAGVRGRRRALARGVHATGALAASTGPASEDAGEVVFLAVDDPRFSASTGPASEDAGESPCPRPVVRPQSRFNGAGVRGRRRGG